MPWRACRSPSIRCRGRGRRWRSPSAFHIILVPLGVSWSVMTLIANYRGIKHDDADAMLLAQRWSKYMAVTFAVGAVTGTVLSFEFGLLWPKFMGQWGAAFGVPFAFEGIFFFTEAVFISDLHLRLAPAEAWAHFWTGVPIAVAGIFGSISVVAANAWMNSPEGVTLDSAGKVDGRRPDGRHLQRRDAADGRPHGGRGVPRRRLPDRLGLRRRDAARPHATATTGWASSSGSPSPRSRPRSRWASATRWPAGSTTTSRPSSPRSRWCRRPAATCPRCCSATSTPKGEVVGGHPDPRPGLDPVRPEHRDVHRRPGPRRDARRRAADRPRGQRRPPRLGRHGRPRHPAVPAHPVVVGVVDLPTRHAQEQVVPPRLRRHRGAGRDHASRRAGRSARSAGSRGSSTRR